MSQPKNPDNRYEFCCRVTKKTIKTNPHQFMDLAMRFAITPAELDQSYVGREGRAIIASQNLTPDMAIEMYGLHPNVANALKATRMALYRANAIKGSSAGKKRSKATKTPIIPTEPAVTVLSSDAIPACKEDSPEDVVEYVYECSEELTEELVSG